MTEIFLPIRGFEDAFEIGSKGTVRSIKRSYVTQQNHLRTFLPQEMKATLHHTGYLNINLRYMGKRRSAYIHTLVLETFDKPMPQGMECCHKDGNKLNNSIDNLYWGSKFDNAKDREKHGTKVYGEKNTRSKLTDSAVKDILLKLNHRTQQSIADEYGVSNTIIHYIAIGKTWKHVPRG